MKNLILAFAATLLSTAAFSQGIIDRHYSNYLNDDDVTHVYVAGKMFDLASVLAAGVDDKDVQELSEFASKIQSFSLIKVPNRIDAKAEFKKGLADVANDYDELIRVRDEGNRFALFIDEEDNVVFEVVGLAIADGEFVALSLVGEMDLTKISDFVSKIDNDDFEPFKRMSEFNPDDMKVYPNPANANAQITVEVPEKMVGGKATLFDTNGRTLKTIDVDSNEVTITTNGLNAGNYFVELQKESVTMKRQVIILQ